MNEGDATRLSRRDALVAVAASAGGIVTAGEVADRLTERDVDEDTLDRVLDGLAAAATVVYPSVVEADRAFLETFVLGRRTQEAAYLVACDEAFDELDRQSEDLFGRSFTALSADRRERVLLEAGVDAVVPDPDGTRVERVRYYVVNQLLFALFTSPQGGELIGNENPPGYPGGTDAYQRGPDEE